jgi:hypothetical protein
MARTTVKADFVSAILNVTFQNSLVVGTMMLLHFVRRLPKFRPGVGITLNSYINPMAVQPPVSILAAGAAAGHTCRVTRRYLADASAPFSMWSGVFCSLHARSGSIPFKADGFLDEAT